VSGHAAAAPPTIEMKSRRLMSPSSQGAKPTTSSGSRNRVVQYRPYVLPT
jgi:hypothetical protein